MNELEKKFDELCSIVHDCTKCIRMNGSQRVLNRSVGSLKSRIMFIGEAPGRLGADDTGVPFHGDVAGHNFEELLEFSGISRGDIYITNAALCNPKDEKGNNASPNIGELTNCSSFLLQQINLINPDIVVTLGANALVATSLIENHSLSLKANVRTANKWYNRILIPLYHPGQRAMMSRSMANQRSDYQFVSDYIDKIEKKSTKKNQTKSSLNVALIIDYLFSKKDNYTYFALHKLFYLIEYKSIQKLGYKITNAYIIRQKDGPYVTDLNLFKIKKALPYLHTRNLSNTNILIYKSSNLFEERLIYQFVIPDEIKCIIDEVYNEYGNKSNASLKRSVYFTQPMRNILYKEANDKINLYNTPIEFSLYPLY